MLFNTSIASFYFYKDFIFIFVYVCISIHMNVCMCGACMCTGVPRGQRKESIEQLWAAHSGNWEPSLNLLEERQVVLIGKLSLQPHFTLKIHDFMELFPTDGENVN